MKKISFIVLLLGLFFGSTATAYAQTSSSDFTYEESDAGITITSYTGDETEVMIPAVIQDKKVVAIDAYAFMLCNTVEKVSVPSTVKNISSTAFTGATNLKEVVLASDETKIENPSEITQSVEADEQGESVGQTETAYNVVVDESVDEEADIIETSENEEESTLEDSESKLADTDNKSEIIGLGDETEINITEICAEPSAKKNANKSNHSVFILVGIVVVVAVCTGGILFIKSKRRSRS